MSRISALCLVKWRENLPTPSDSSSPNVWGTLFFLFFFLSIPLIQDAVVSLGPARAPKWKNSPQGFVCGSWQRQILPKTTSACPNQPQPVLNNLSSVWLSDFLLFLPAEPCKCHSRCLCQLPAQAPDTLHQALTQEGATLGWGL